jgi:hypothetical protein
MPANLAIISPTLPPHLACYQELINAAIGGAIIQIDTTGFTNILQQASTPTATQRGYSWHNTNDDRIYRWDAGISAWVSRHPYTFGTDVRLFWTGSLANIATFDGGEAGTVGAASGPMWERDTSMDGRVAIGAGTLPSGTSLTIGDTGGEDKHTQLVAELALHTHTLQNVDNNTNTLAAGTGTGGGIVIPRNSAQTDAAGSSTPFNVLNPYRAGTWIKRTGRIFYRA